MKKLEVFNGNNIELLKSYPDNYFDSVVTDPPYGLGKEPNAEQMLQAWITEGYLEVKGSGFMGKEWDAFVPQPIFWKEVFRVLKCGGHVVSFFGTRTYDWGVMAMRLAGFEVRDCIQWVYGSGFPKSHNISKAVDKMYGAEREVVGSRKLLGTAKTLKGNNYNGDNNKEKTEIYEISIPSTEEAKEWEGWGSALKPANEPIVLARKPLEKGLSIAENVLKYGTGGINIDGCRVSHNEPIKVLKAQEGGNKVYSQAGRREDTTELKEEGRFPANLILTHHPQCECKGLKKVKGQIDKPTNRTEKGNTWDEKNSGLRNKLPQNSGGFADENGEETIENWTCHEDCPIRIMDEQSGVSKGENKLPYTYEENEYKVKGFINNVKPQSPSNYNDKGGASRFFYVAKASKKERNKGLEEFGEKVIEGRDIGQDERSVAYKPRPTPTQNFHPTIKPVALMRYLVRLVTPPNGIVLDPFNGSGTTGVACKVEGFNYVGLELDPEYCKISEARIQGWEEEVEMPEAIEQKEVKKESAEEIKENNQLNLF